MRKGMTHVFQSLQQHGNFCQAAMNKVLPAVISTMSFPQQVCALDQKLGSSL